MIWLIVLAFIACVAPSVGCFLTLNATIRELRRKLNLTNARLKDEEEWTNDRLWGLARGQETVKEVLREIVDGNRLKAELMVALDEKLKATFEYVRAVDRGDHGTYLRMELNQIRTDFELAFKQSDERLLELEYPGIREAQAYDQKAAAEEARFHEESAIDASAPVQCLRDYLTSVGKENLMTHADLLKEVEQLFEKLSNTATRVEELEEKNRG